MLRRDEKGRFVRGASSWNTGTKGMTGANSRSFKKGEKPPEHKEGCKCFRCDPNFIVPDREKQRRIRDAHKLGISNMGRKHTEETRKKQSDIKKKNLPKYAFKKGMIPWNYIDGRSKILSPDRYGDDWFKIRLVIYKRDNFTCQECGITMKETGKPHHVHHIIPFLQSFDNSLTNLVTLCPSCHGKIECVLIKKLKAMEAEV